jgi:hypothetical protein
MRAKPPISRPDLHDPLLTHRLFRLFLIRPGASTVIPLTGTAGNRADRRPSNPKIVRFLFALLFPRRYYRRSCPGIGGRGRDAGDIVQEGGRHTAISKALDSRNAAGPRGLV